MSLIFAQRLSQDMPHKKAQIANEINGLSDRDLRANEPRDLVSPILEDLGFGKVGEITNRISKAVSEVDATVGLFVQTDGDMCILQYEPSRRENRKLDHVEIKSGVLVFTYDRDELPRGVTVKQRFEEDLRIIRAAMPILERDIVPFKQELEAYALSMIMRRRRSKAIKDDTLDGLDYPDASGSLRSGR